MAPHRPLRFPDLNYRLLHMRYLPALLQPTGSRLRRLIGTIVLGVALTSSLFAHGTLLSPMSRVYRVYLNNPENPTTDWARAALQVSTKNAFYTWNQVSQNIPDFNHRAVVPDGHLASGGNPTYFGIDLPRADWPATSVAPGNFQLYWWATAAHEPSYFDVYITKPGYDPTQPLTWAMMEKIGSQVPYWKEDNNHWRLNITLPQRTGKHVLWLLWQRIDPVGEVFFTASDINFDGTVTENPIVVTPEQPPVNPPTPPTPTTVTPPSAFQTQIGNVRLDFSSDSAWIGGYRAAVKITNLGTQPLENWRVLFSGSFVITSLWDGRYLCDGATSHTVAGPAWAPTLAAGASATFGFSVSGPIAAPTSFTVESTTPQPPPPPSGATVKAELRFDSTWGTGFNATLRITNTGTTAIQGWTAAFEAPFTIGSAWNGTYKKVGGVHTLSAASWNARIEPGKFVDVGFGGTGVPKPVTDIVVRTGP